MKILLASPGTGKTTKVKKIVSDDYSNAATINVISFTNATVNDLTEDLAHFPNVSCSTLHSLAFRLNHLPDLRVIDNKTEIKIIHSYADKLNIDFAQFCRMIRCITFDGMIESCVSFMKANPAYAESKIGRMDLLVVDEFQDFNPFEQQLVMLLSELATETIILGDDDQSIYGFKDADPDGIIHLYNNVKIDKLAHDNVCYRCPDEVVSYSKKLIHKNKRRVVKDWHGSGISGGVHFKQLLTQAESDNYIETVVGKIRAKYNDASVLILSPLAVVVESLKVKFANDGIVFNDCWPKGWDKDILCMVWWLNAIYGKMKLSFVLCLLKHYGAFGKKDLCDHLIVRFQGGFDENDLVRELIGLGYLPEPFSSYINSNPQLNDLLKDHPEYNVFTGFLDEHDLAVSVATLAHNYHTKSEFQKGEINLMSIHNSKGLQADYVIICGLVNGILPNKEQGLDSIEAQRRLLFVGMTRAKKELLLVSTVQWDGKVLHGNYADMGQFQYNWRKKTYLGKTSTFVEEII